MPVYNVKASRNTTVTLKTGMINIPQGFSVRVNSNWPFDWDGFKRAVEHELGGSIIAFSNDGTWKWEQM